MVYNNLRTNLMENRVTKLRQTIVLMIERMKMQALVPVLCLLSGILSKETWSFVKSKPTRTDFNYVRAVKQMQQCGSFYLPIRVQPVYLQGLASYSMPPIEIVALTNENFKHFISMIHRV